MKDTEKEVYMAAFSKSKAGSYDGRKAEAQAAVDAHKNNAKGAIKAVEKGIKEGTLSERIAARRARMDKEIDG